MARPRICRLSAALAACCLLTGCFGSPNPDRSVPPPAPHVANLPLPPGSTVEAAGEHPSDGSSDRGTHPSEVRGSLRPDEQPPQARIPEIHKRGRVIVGVDQAQNLLSFRDPATGEVHGFEADLARELAQDIFGSRDAVEFRFLDSGEAWDMLRQHQVDLVVRAMTITPDRQNIAAFSTPYLTVNTRMLVPRDLGVNTKQGVNGKTVCVGDGSTTLDRARRQLPNSPLLKVRSWTDCLVAVQQNQAQAIMANDPILSGIAAQDPYLQMIGPPLGTEQYGVAMPKQHSDGLVRQVNSTLERTFHDGTWQRLYNRWLAPYQSGGQPPEVNYRGEQDAAAHPQSQSEEAKP